MSASLANYFVGRVLRSEYAQAVGMEQIPTYYMDGVPMGWHYVVYKADFVEDVFEFIGVPASLKDSTGTVTVTDVGGTQYTVSLDKAVTVQGLAMFETMSNRVQRIRMSPHLWRIVVTHRTGTLHQNS